ncbi:MAG: Flp pilus assembly complex ATPase component TadA [Alicyclobacillaceae bacterium]|nr:Flp pilus assembly complex ATPase component TadA [Alicyclobacillaceae bacterium]
MEQQGAVRALAEILDQAVAVGATDIHVEPDGEVYHVRLRRNGVLQLAARWDGRTGTEIVQRVKLLARLDIAERRTPQDGHMQLPVAGQSRNMRVATLPTVRGERLVIRIHAGDCSEQRGPESGKDDEFVWNRWMEWVGAPHGLLLIAGTTGSGKTTSFYRVIRHWVREGRCVITMEDPVEQWIPGAHQVEIQPRRGMTFTHVLPATLRQDPEALGVGEIRDGDAAWAAVQAALSGCKVVATIHAAGPQEVRYRLQRWGIGQGEMESALLAVLTQRLAPRLCPHCRRRSGAVRGSGGRVALVWTAEGCEHCGGRGRAGVIPLYHLAEKGRDDWMSTPPSWEEIAWPKVAKGDLGEEWYHGAVAASAEEG